MSNELYFTAMKEKGLSDAAELQKKSSDMTGTELNDADSMIPSFQAAVKAKNMMERHAGNSDGFVCKSTAGRVVRLIQNYDSDTYPQEPEELPAQWKFVWSTNPKKALPFIELSTSPYMKNDCCTYEGHVYRSGQDNNVWAPGTATIQWEDLGTIEEIMGTTGEE